uniref:Putative reverse transcriptase and intron maturase n=1 Tax=Sykidion marinum TaxID=44573 RepID=A0A1W6EGL8_SYKMA|nr:putative reverse transcriptase and intron maturase [Pseudoneochloris marina]ARK14544.1 putative reverse transcriptase and intron maturase [Pseudoneochloris marina]
MTKLARLIAINKMSKKDSKWIHKEIFRILNKDEIWIAAYEKLKSNKGALTPGSTPETMDGMSLDRLRRLKDQVLSESYAFKTVKLTYIARPDGRKRPLGLPTANDKIVQEVIRMILEAIYEPNFSEFSFGFRQGLGCHDALNHVEQRFRWVDYVIEGDIEQAYPTIDHHTLVGFLKERIDDPRFIRLIWKLLGCGVLEEERIRYSKTGIPQGSIVSPILANIYYHELDKFVKNLMNIYMTPIADRKSLKTAEYKSLEYQISKLGKQMNELPKQSAERKLLSNKLKSLRNKRLDTPSLKNKPVRVEYVRYADDWMLGVSGEKSLAIEIKDQLTTFMKNTLQQNLHPTKTKITDLRKGNVYFLGYEIFLPLNRPISTYKGKGVQTIRRGNPMLRFDIPVSILTKRYAERGYLKLLTKGSRPISKSSYTVLEDHVIVSHYRSLWQGIYNYYLGCTNRGRLQYIHYLMHMSCAMTLAHRHRTSASKIFKKHGKTLTIKIPNTDREVSFPYRSSWRISDRGWLIGKKVIPPIVRYANLVSRSSLGSPCIICDSEEGSIEMHHVKHVRKNGFRYKGFTEQMALLNRKQVPLCKQCHQKVHSGLYDGPSLESLRKKYEKI